MKGKLLSNLPLLLKQCHREPVNRNNRFWVEVVNSLSSAIRASGCPVFLSSWIKEVLGLLEDRARLNITLVMPKDGCWGIYIKDRESYLFSYNDGQRDIYISKRLYEHLKEKSKSRLLAGVILHEATELIMYQKAKKKGRVPDLGKIHGEAARVEREFLGKEVLPDDVIRYLVELEQERKNVMVDKQDVYVEGCALSGEEIVAEISSVMRPEESYMAELAPGERKKINYSGGKFTVEARAYEEPFTLEGIDFKDYCNLMKIMDDYFIEESILEGPYRDLLDYIRNLNYFDESSNLLLKLLWLFTQRFWTNKTQRKEFLYNIYLLIDEYLSYFEMLEVIKTKYWMHTKYVKDHIEKIVSEVCDKKQVLLEKKKENTAKMKDWALRWFSRMEGVPHFVEIEDWTKLENIPRNFDKLYKKPGRGRILKYEKDIVKELSIHESILCITRMIGGMKDEYRGYSGIKRQEGSKVCELLMIRTHFWKREKLFKRGEKVGVYTPDKKGRGVVEVLDIMYDSMIVSLTSFDSVIPEIGFLKKLEGEDESVSVQIEAINNVTKGKGMAEKVLKMGIAGEKKEELGEICFFNPVIGENPSQKEAVSKALGKDMVTLIQGPPGTGKTTVIAEIVLQYLKKGKRILLSSQTNNAVDNALDNIMKYKEPGTGIGRVASKQEKIVDSGIKGIWIKDKRGLDSFEGNFKNGLVIGATNVGTHTLNLMKEREFDVLVMDEAGKSNIVESILPMLLLRPSGKLVIVGDHMQGMPFEYDESIVDLFIEMQGLADSRKIISLKERLNQSLFERMVERGAKSVMLRINYRSEPQIVGLVSRLFYRGLLIPAKTEQRKAKSIVVVDTSKVASPDERGESEGSEGKGYKNIYEARLILKEIKELLRYRYIATGIKSRHVPGVTILAPYLMQVEEIRKALSGGLRGVLSRTAIGDLINNTTTIDSFQGRENEIIIISFTRSNMDPSKVGFLSEFNRINVALSRAKRKMILIGDFRTLQNARHGARTKATREIFRTIYRFR